MQALLTRILGLWHFGSPCETVKPEVLVDKRAKVVPLAASRDITRTQEFWDKAVPS